MSTMSKTSFEKVYREGSRTEVYLLRGGWHIRRYSEQGQFLSERVTGSWETARAACPWLPAQNPTR